MKRILYTLLTATALLVGNYFFPISTLEATIETPTPLPSPTLPPLPGTVVPTLVGGPTHIPTPILEIPRDPYGEVYFSVTEPDMSSQTDPNIPIDKFITRLTRLPGSCVVGLIECPAVEEVPTPFDMNDVYKIGGDSKNMEWSPDGRYAALVIHPEDEFTDGWTPEEWEQFKQKKPSIEEFQISPSTLYLFDAQTDTWRELYRADRKFFYSLRWSRDGQWLAFKVAASEFTFHPAQSDDGVYIIHPDGSGLKNLGGNGNFINGWIGNSLLVWRPIDPASGSFAHVMEMLSMDGEVTPIIESSHAVSYSLAPDGGGILSVDGQDNSLPYKSVNLLALDGSLIRSFGTFTNHVSMIDPIVWSSDGSLIAFPNGRRVYVVPRESPGLPQGALGIPLETREVYAADDTTSQPQFFGFEFSSDNKYLLMHFWDGITRVAAVALDSGQVILPLGVPKPTDSTVYQDVASFSWRP